MNPRGFDLDQGVLMGEPAAAGGSDTQIREAAVVLLRRLLPAGMVGGGRGVR